MKDEKNKTIKVLAEEIAHIEKECQSEHNVSENMKKLEQLIRGLSLQEMLEIDTYIKEKKLLTK